MSGGRGKHCITHPQASDDLLCEQIIDRYRRALAHHEQARRFLLTYGIFRNRLLSDFRLGGLRPYPGVAITAFGARAGGLYPWGTSTLRVAEAVRA